MARYQNDTCIRMLKQAKEYSTARTDMKMKPDIKIDKLQIDTMTKKGVNEQREEHQVASKLLQLA